MPTLCKVLESTLHLENLDGHLLAAQILERIITLSSRMVIADFRSSEAPYDSPPGSYLHIRVSLLSQIQPFFFCSFFKNDILNEV